MSGDRARSPDLPDRGSASLLVLALCAVVVLLAGVLVAVGGAAVARRRAAISADAAALAAAGAALHGEQAACRAARLVAEAQGGRVLSCRITGDVADLLVVVRPTGPLGRLGPARGRARAGPA